MTRKDLEEWQKYIVGKPCQDHPDRIVKMGKFGLWCGAKDELGTWCHGGSVNLKLLTPTR